jgi:1,4-dihydroxy-2-naphthoate octaprenyltransferase
MVNIPLVKGFKATNRINAFILNSLRAALVIVLTITAKDYFDKYTTTIDVNHTADDDDEHSVVIRQTSVKSLLISFLVAFTVSMIAFSTLYVVFGFGGGLLTDEFD